MRCNKGAVARDLTRIHLHDFRPLPARSGLGVKQVFKDNLRTDGHAGVPQEGLRLLGINSFRNQTRCDNPPLRFVRFGGKRRQ